MNTPAIWLKKSKIAAKNISIMNIPLLKWNTNIVTSLIEIDPGSVFREENLYKVLRYVHCFAIIQPK